MKRKIPTSPFSTRLSGSARETELRLRNIFQWKKKRPPAVFVVLAILVVAACGDLVEFTSSGEKEVDNSSHTETSGTPISELVIAEGETVLKDGANVTVKLVMREGSFLTAEKTGYGGGFESGNYVGSCELQVWQGNTKITDYALEGEATGDMVYSFTGFSLEFDDYNNDGDPDFTVGQYGGSNAQMYSLFTLSEDAAIRMISAPYGIFSTDGKTNGYYSTLLAKTKNGFVVSIYNNTIGKTVQVNYAWDETSGQFLQEETNNSDVENGRQR